MICLRCGKSEKGGPDYCNPCFIRIIEKRLKKTLRDSKLLEPDVTLVAENELILGLLEKLVNMPVKLALKGKGVHVIGESIDDVNVAFLKKYMLLDHAEKRECGERKKEEKQSKLGKQEKCLNLFAPLTDADLKRYCKLKKLKYVNREDSLKKPLLVLAEKYPETPHALYNASQEYKRHVHK